MGSETEELDTLLIKRVKMFQSALKDRPKKTPMRMAAGRAIRFSVSPVGIAIASCPNWMNGRREYPGGGMTSRNKTQSTRAVTMVNARKTYACACKRYQ